MHPNRRPIEQIDPGATVTPSRLTMASEPASKQREGLSLQTLIVAAVASGIAAVVVSHIWKGGTVLAAAMTPVIVSIMKELLRRPIESDIVRRGASKVSGVATAPGRAVVGGASGRRPSSVTRTTPPPPPMPRAPNGEMLQAGPVRTYGGSGRARSGGNPLARLRGRPLKIAIATGLLAFVVAAVVLTVPELIFGGSVSSGHGTTIFGGSSSSQSKSDKNNKDQGSQDQQNNQSSTQPQDNGSTSTSTTPQQTTPSQTPTQTQPQQSTPPSSSPPSGGGGGSAPPTPAPTPPSP